MNDSQVTMNRRVFLRLLAALGATSVAGGLGASPRSTVTRSIPVSGNNIPVIGMGSWITFDVGNDSKALATRVEVLRTFFERGGTLIDSSPMYGSSEATIGHCLNALDRQEAVFAATKVWTWGKSGGIAQMKASRELWGVPRFELMQIHNMVDWGTHYPTLRDWKEQGRIRYIGITTSHGRRHEQLEYALNKVPFDFVQFTYNIADREAESRLLPLATDLGVGVIINRPFRRGSLFDAVSGKPLPEWADEIGCANWAQFFLKFIVSHPAVTCAIPATSRVDHMQENMGALRGPLPDAALRRRMVDYFERVV
jgi:diketogulonate reductase-like aldo/keto reductase